jgi:uncharacterized protein YerC
MFQTFWDAVSKINHQDEIQEFLNNLLSPTERTMLAKRLAIAVLLMKKYNYENIMDLLKVSSATISKVALTLNYNIGYKKAINKVAHTEATREFWQDVENLLFRFSAPGRLLLPEEVVKAKLRHTRKTLV